MTVTESDGSKEPLLWLRNFDPDFAETYRLLERLGGGTMGEVYAVEHLRTGRQVALKLLRGHLGSDTRAVMVVPLKALGA